MSEKNWRLYHYNMLERCERILRALEEEQVTKEDFVTRGFIYDGLMMNLQIIGENASKIPEDVKRSYPEIPWPRIIFLRHVISHDYDALEENSLWETLTIDVPQLRDRLIKMKDYNEDEGI